MVKVTLTTSALLLSFLASATATKINFVNKCATPVELYHSERFEKLEKLSDIAAGASYSRDVTGTAHMFRHGFDTDATLVEFSMPNDGKAWYDISVIPPMPGHCRSFEECKQVTGKRGFNLPVNISPKQNANAKNCRALACPADDKEACADAYHFPDDVKTHDCPASTEFDVVFCPSGSGGGSNNNGGSYGPAPTTQAPAATPAANNNNNNNNNNNQQQQKKKGSYSNTGSNNNNNGNSGNSNYGFNSANGQSQQGTVAPASDDTVSGEAATLGKVRATYTYKGKQAGNVPGSYDRVTKLSGCVKEKVSLNSPVGPLSEEVSLVFRGPMDVYNIAVFDGSGGNSTFSRVSSYDRSTGDADNLVFMNNKNIDYSGKGSHGPQGYATEDGASKSDAPCKKFKGLLKEASDPNKVGGGPGIQTGVEVNIMTAKKCNGDCLGYHGDNDHHGWGGGRKVFVTKVQMPHGAKPNQPALWMLNAQVLHSNQYGCNCRGVGAVGGCGELDIAEVIETNDARDRVTTHHYFYDGSILSPGGDNFAARPVDKAVTYVTLIDDRDGGMIKIAEVEDFDYSKKELSSADIQQLLDA